MSDRLPDAKRRFIEFWGEMASNWGVSRTMSQVFALLFASPSPLDTDTIMEELDISRGNANMNLHKLIGWGLVRKIELPDSRKDFFVAEKDVWRMALNIVRYRQELELNPVLESLRGISDSILLDEAGNPRQPTPEEVAFRENIQNMCNFMVMFNQLTSLLMPLLENQNAGQLQSLLSLLGAAVRPEPKQG